MTRQSPRAEATPYWLWPWCLFLFLIPFEMVLAGLNLSLALNGLGVGSALLIALAARRTNRPGRVSQSRHLAIAALVLVMHLSFFSSLNPAETRLALIPIAILWGIYLLANSSALTPSQVEWGVRSWCWGGGAAALLTIACTLQGLRGPDGRGSIVLRGVEVDPNFLTASFLLPAAVGLYLLRQRKTRLEALLILSLIGWASALTESRGGVIALAAVVFATLAWDRRWKALGVVFVSLVAVYLTFAPMLGRFNVKADPTGNGRTDVWRIALSEGARQGPTGMGFSTFPEVSGSASGFYWSLAPHNTYLQAFAEVGILGLLALLAVMLTHLRFSQRSPLAGAMFAALAGLGIAAMFLHLLAFKVLWGAWMVASQVAMAHAPAQLLPRARILAPRALTP